MKTNQLIKGQNRRVMYIENRDGDIGGVTAKIGWAEFSKSGRTVYYRGKSLKRATGCGISGNHCDEDTCDEYWISGIKKRGSNAHWAESTKVSIDEDAMEEYKRLRDNVK